MPQRSVSSEVGVWKGDFTRLILEIVKPRELHLIDPWEFQNESPNRIFGGRLAEPVNGDLLSELDFPGEASDRPWGR